MAGAGVREQRAQSRCPDAEPPAHPDPDQDRADQPRGERAPPRGPPGPGPARQCGQRAPSEPLRFIRASRGDDAPGLPVRTGHHPPQHDQSQRDDQSSKHQAATDSRQPRATSRGQLCRRGHARAAGADLHGVAAADDVAVAGEHPIPHPGLARPTRAVAHRRDDRLRVGRVDPRRQARHATVLPELEHDKRRFDRCHELHPQPTGGAGEVRTRRGIRPRDAGRRGR